MNKLRQKLESGVPMCGTHVNFCDPSICEIVGQLGFDFIWIDMEHSYLSLKELMGHLEAARAAGTPTIVRVPQHDLTYTKKILEMGPDGIIFPMIHNAAEAEELVKYALYPPYGTRGFGPMSAIGFGERDAQEYVDKTHLDMVRLIQIEHKTAVDELEKIVQNPWIDAYVFGPNDLSGSINQLGHVYEADTRALMERAIAILKKAGKRVGVSTGSSDEAVFRYWRDMGIDIISAGSDFGHLLEASKTTLEHLRRVL